MGRTTAARNLGAALAAAGQKVQLLEQQGPAGREAACPPPAAASSGR